MRHRFGSSIRSRIFLDVMLIGVVDAAKVRFVLHSSNGFYFLYDVSQLCAMV